jgi:hypothetical protein
VGVMAIFRCVIRGEQFPFLVNNAWTSKGFYTTRYVEAPSADDAEMIALDMLRDDPALQRDPSTPGLDKAQVFFDEIEQVSERGANTGFIFFEDDH